MIEPRGLGLEERGFYERGAVGESNMQDDVTALMSSDSLTGRGSGAQAQSRAEAEPPGERRRPEDETLPPGSAVGRYLVIDLLGEGGMGVVYRAYDPKLQREIALKCLRADVLSQEARSRMLREAQSMAKLSHPNVVAVYDVEEESDHQVRVAMEYVDGETLRAWMKAVRRPWREIVHRFQEAGRGLLAAHEAGILHRDFKPANVLLGEDTRARVTDFGLARLQRGRDSSHSSEAGSLDADAMADADGLTQLGQVMGTPAYMAPEQHAATALGPAADQYAFCVSLWQGLTGERPFDGDSLKELVVAKRKGPPPWPKGLSVPRPIVDAVRRGLAPEADQRWPSMARLLDALAYDPRVVQRRWGLRLGAVTLVGVSALAVAGWQRNRAGVCDAAADSANTVWNDGHRERVRQALERTGVEYAASVWERTESTMDAYVRDWSAMRTEACEATTVRGERSATVMDLRMNCLDRASIRLAAVVEVLSRADRETLQHADDIANGLPDLQRCADVEALAAAVPPPEDPRVASEVQTLLAQLAEAHALLHGGKYEDARKLAQSVAEVASRVDYVPLGTHVALARAQAEKSAAAYGASEAAYRTALLLALEWGQWPEALEASQGLAFLLGVSLARFDEARAFADMALGLTARRQFGPKHRADTLSVLAELHSVQGRPAEAETLHREVLELRIKALGPSHRTVAVTRSNLAGALQDLGHYADAEAEYRAVLQLRRASLGAAHPDVASSMNALATCLQEQGRFDEASALLEQSLAIKVAAVGERHPSVASTRNNIANVLDSKGAYAEAQTQYETALSIFEEAFGPEHPDVAMVRNNLANALYLQGRYDESEREYRRALEIRKRSLPPEHPEVADSRNNVALALYILERHDEAAVLYREAISALERTRGPMHASLGYPYSNLGLVHLALGETDEAERNIRRSLDIRTHALGPDHVETGMSRNNLALVLRERGELDASVEEFGRAIRVYETALGSDHPDLGTAHTNLGDTLMALGRTPEAEQEYRAGLKNLEPAVGPDHVRTSQAYSGLSAVAKARGNLDDARSWSEKAWAALEHSETYKMERAQEAFSLAQLLIDTPGGRQRAAVLAQEAFSTYDALQDEDAEQRQKVAGWLRRHAIEPRGASAP